MEKINWQDSHGNPPGYEKMPTHKRDCTRKNRGLCECDPSSASSAWKIEPTGLDIDTLALIDRIKNEKPFREFAIHAVSHFDNVKAEFLRLLHLAETPGDFSKQEESDILLEAGELAGKLELFT